MEEKEEKAKKKEMKQLPSGKNKYVIVTIIIVLLALGWFGFKAFLGSFQSYRLDFVDAPSEVSAGSIVTFTWKISGPPTMINHTAVYLGKQSTPEDLGKDVDPKDTNYTDYVKDFADGEFNIPLQFIGNITVGEPGKYYYRAHAIVKDKHYWSDEYTFEVKKAQNKVVMVNAPKEIKSGSIATFTWRVEGPPATINKTVVYFGKVSTPGDLAKDTKPEATNYTDYVKDFADGEFNIPLQFVGNAKIATPGSYFFRGYALINGQHYWTDEGTLEVKR